MIINYKNKSTIKKMDDSIVKYQFEINEDQKSRLSEARMKIGDLEVADK